MVHMVVKPDPDADFYAVYSTVTDGFIECGTREELLQVPHRIGAGRAADRRRELGRADEFGTSAYAYNEPGSMGWGDDVILIRDGGPDLRCLPRAAVRDYLAASRIDRERAFAALERAIDDDAPDEEPADLV